MNDPLQSVKAPAIALLISGIVSGAFAVIILISGLVRLAAGDENLPVNEAERFGFLVGTFATYFVAFLSLVSAPIITFGAYKMLGGAKYGLAKIAAVLSVIPATSCCFIAGVPIGIWSLIVLAKPEVKAMFNGEDAVQREPPSPPSFR